MNQFCVLTIKKMNQPTHYSPVNFKNHLSDPQQRSQQPPTRQETTQPLPRPQHQRISLEPWHYIQQIPGAEKADPIVKPATGIFRRFYMDFQEFMFANNVLIIATGWGIGTATKEMIERLVHDIFIPTLHQLSRFSLMRKLYVKMLSYSSSIPRLEAFVLTIGNVTWDLIIWLAVIVLTFLLLEYVFYRGILQLKTTIREESRPEFLKSKAAAANEKIIPDERDREIMEKRLKVEEETGKLLLRQEKQEIETMSSSIVT